MSNTNTAPARKRSEVLSRDMGRAPTTSAQDKSAIDLFNHFLVDILGLDDIDEIDMEVLSDDLENILTGYSYYLCNTNIPVNFKKYLADPELEPTQFMVYSGLKTYLSKALNLLQKLLPNHEFWKNEEAVADITGASFEKACRRSQQKKDANFGQESKVGLYRIARYGRSYNLKESSAHWINAFSCEAVCKVMLKKTVRGDTANRFPEKRLSVVVTKQGVGRGGEARYLDISKMYLNPFYFALDTLWVEAKNLKTYSCPFVPNKDEYATDICHSVGCFAVMGDGFRRTPGEDGKISTRLIPYLTDGMAPANVSRFITRAIRSNLPEEVPKKERESVSAVSLRIASITEMGAGGVGFYPSHARSGHAIPSNQAKYVDAEDVVTSLPAAKCLAGWTDYNADVHFPDIYATGASSATIEKLISYLAVINVPEFLPTGRLRPFLEACIASLLMWDSEVVSDNGVNNNLSLTLRQAFRRANIVDERAGSADATLTLWGDLIMAKFRADNPDFRVLTDESNGAEFVKSVNAMAKMVTTMVRENGELRRDHRRLLAEVGALRDEHAKLREEIRASNTQEKGFLVAILSKLERLLSWFSRPLASSPQRHPASPRSLSPPMESRKRPFEDISEGNPAPAVAASIATAGDVDCGALLPPPPPLAAVSVASAAAAPAPAIAPVAPSAATAARTCTLEKNYNLVDADGVNGGSNLEGIIQSAYLSGRFKSTVSFTEDVMGIPGRFKDKTKYKSCLVLFQAVATQGQRAQLAQPNLTMEELDTVAREIADACMARLRQLEGGPKPRATKGYTGVGARVASVKRLYPTLSNADGRQTTMNDFPRQRRASGGNESGGSSV